MEQNQFLSASQGSKSHARITPLTDVEQFAEIKGFLEDDYADLKVSVIEVDGETTLHADHGGMKVFWIYEGRGEVFLPEGYRTQEGGAEPLPDTYQSDKIDPIFAEKLQLLKQLKEQFLNLIQRWLLHFF